MVSAATALAIPTNQDRVRIRSPSPQNPNSVTRPSTSNSASASSSSTRQSTRSNSSRRYSSSETKENEPVVRTEMVDGVASPRRTNGRLPSEEYEMNGKAGGLDSESSTIRARRAAASPGTAKRQLADPVYNGLPTLPTIGDDDDVLLSSGPSSPTSGRPPPPAPSARAGSDPNYGNIAGSGTRKRRSSSIKRKLSPGVTPQKAVDWEIPRKAFHSSIGAYLFHVSCASRHL